MGAVWRLGLVLGIVGLTETVFPGARFPYVTNTLIATYAALAGGLRVGFIAAGDCNPRHVCIKVTPGSLGTVVALLVSLLVGSAIRRFVPVLPQAGYGVCGWNAGTSRRDLSLTCPDSWDNAPGQTLLPHALVSIPAEWDRRDAAPACLAGCAHP